MTYPVLLLVTLLFASSAKVTQTFNIPIQRLDIDRTLHVRPFNSSLGTLTKIEVQSAWHVNSVSDDYDVNVSLGLPEHYDAYAISNHFIGDNNGDESDWGLAVGVDPVDFGDYLGHSLIPFEVNFTINSSGHRVYGSLHLTVTYIYDQALRSSCRR